jgi:Tfp pilus assembly protein PilO
MTDLERRPWWHAFITPQNILTAVLAIFAAGGYWQDAKQVKDRLDRLERRVEAERTLSDLTYMRRDVLTEQLRQIQEEQTRMREQVQLLRRDLR